MNKPTNQQGSILTILVLILVTGLGLVIFSYFYLGQDDSRKLITQLTQVKDQFKNQVKDLASNRPPGGKTSVLPASDALILITKDGFIPSTITVAKGQQVTWVNEQSSNHQVISQEEQFQFDSDILSPSDSFSVTFEKSGTYTIKDRLSLLRIKGVVVVE